MVGVKLKKAFSVAVALAFVVAVACAEVLKISVAVGERAKEKPPLFEEQAATPVATGKRAKLEEERFPFPLQLTELTKAEAELSL